MPFDYICKMKQIEIEELENWYHENYQNKISGRRVIIEQIIPIMNNLNPLFKVNKIGVTHFKKEIRNISFGKGNTKILIWTQMHGNESSGTKALFDFLNFIERPGQLTYFRDKILNNCKLLCVPMLNPDGAEAYTRVNSRGIDLNRDVIDKKAVESRILQDILLEFQPDYCFNMHDQRTIFSVGKNNKPATLSFLAPSEDKERSLTEGRIETMKVIVSMYNLLKKCIPGQIGRYTDEFYPTATGDNFQKMGFNTVLIESGHYKGDYQREITRKYTFFALLQGILYTVDAGHVEDHQSYFEIPDNEKKYLDIILKNVKYQGEKVDIGILYEEKLRNNEVCFDFKVDKIEDLSNYNADKIIDKVGINFKNLADVVEWLKNKNI